MTLHGILRRGAWLRLLSLAVTLTALSVAGGVQAQSLPSTLFSQLDMFLDDGSHPNSDWGSVDVTYTGLSSLHYLNVSVNGSWQVQNIPVLSVEGIGVPQTMTYNFNLGVPNGVDYLGSLSYGITLTAGVGAQPAEAFSQLSIPTRIVSQFAGEQGPPTAITYSPASALIGAAIGGALGAAKGAPGFPNQEAGVDECVPVAVSNSLQYLNAQHGLGMAAADITIAKMKTATGWTADGCPIGWWDVKDRYMKDNNLPIITTTTTDVAKAIMELGNKCDIELGSPNHRAAVTGITDLGGGKYSIDVAHDTDQGNAGGTKTETVSYDTATGKLTGATFFNNVNFRNFVIECPDFSKIPEPSAALLATIGLAMMITRRRR